MGKNLKKSHHEQASSHVTGWLKSCSPPPQNIILVPVQHKPTFYEGNICGY